MITNLPFNFLHQRRAGADQELRYSAIEVKTTSSS